VARVKAQEFQRQIGRFQDLALHEPVEITRHGRDHLVLLSAEEYKRLKSRDRRAYAAHELPEDLAEAVGRSKAPSRHRKLDRLLDKP
jgi:prevent-host-death family protein